MNKSTNITLFECYIFTIYFIPIHTDLNIDPKPISNFHKKFIF